MGGGEVREAQEEEQSTLQGTGFLHLNSILRIHEKSQRIFEDEPVVPRLWKQRQQDPRALLASQSSQIDKLQVQGKTLS